MDVARLNFSHGSYDSHKLIIANIRAAAKQVGKTVAIMQDLQGRVSGWSAPWWDRTITWWGGGLYSPVAINYRLITGKKKIIH